MASIPIKPEHLTRFHSRAPPGIGVKDYLLRIVNYASIENSALILLLIYIDRMCERNPQFTICSLTIHRFTIAAVTTGSKSLSDLYCTNSHYAKIGGISLSELNMLEIELCKRLDWDLSCTLEQLQTYYFNLVRTSRLFSFQLPSTEERDAQDL